MGELPLSSVTAVFYLRTVSFSKILVGLFGKGSLLIMFNNCIFSFLFPMTGSMNTNGECYVDREKNPNQSHRMQEQGPQRDKLKETIGRKHPVSTGQMCERHDGHLPLPASGLMQLTQANPPVLLAMLCSPPSFLSYQHAYESPQVCR